VLLMGANRFEAVLQAHGLSPLLRDQPTTLQLNLGKRCNQSCRHCHVGAGPTRTEMMTGQTVERVLQLLRASPAIHTVDITGGAPELNPHFRRLVTGARAAGRSVMDRCNLTVLSEPGQEDTAAFLADHEVEVVASLPCYGPENVDAQRGRGVFERSITALKQLNALGYASPDTDLELHLVYNPLGAFLPPPQASLEQAYKERLLADHGVRFSRLYTLTNMPIDRFAGDLRRQGALDAYMGLLQDSFNPDAVSGLMCRSTISVGWEGELYDCDFNQMLQMPAGDVLQTVWEVDCLDDLAAAPVATGMHCLGCTAGAGSSCGGAIA
jgi:radical SAM/Cys-rich protein